MSSPPALADWMKSQLTALYAPPSVVPPTDDVAAQLSIAVDAAFAPDAEIRLNHALVDRTAFREFVQSRRAAGGTTEVVCSSEDLIEAAVDEGDVEAGTIVAGKVTLVRTHKFRIRAARAKTRTVIVFSAKILQNPDPQIVQLFQTSVDKPFEVAFPTARAAPQTQAVDAGAAV
ncbi:hypothetical protein C8R44DRAFT_863707 [Mycena epipterygia]|nr:hypothetical protein C8R44DRAFT_863707 [Mycena epipterygia]